mgnify:CR=1 FL=1
MEKAVLLKDASLLDENGNYVFDVDEGFTLNRFRADIYGHPLILSLIHI